MDLECSRSNDGFVGNPFFSSCGSPTERASEEIQEAGVDGDVGLGFAEGFASDGFWFLEIDKEGGSDFVLLHFCRSDRAKFDGMFFDAVGDNFVVEEVDGRNRGTIR